MYVCIYVRFSLPTNPHNVCLSTAAGPSSPCAAAPLHTTLPLTVCTRSALHSTTPISCCTGREGARKRYTVYTATYKGGGGSTKGNCHLKGYRSVTVSTRRVYNRPWWLYQYSCCTVLQFAWQRHDDEFERNYSRANVYFTTQQQINNYAQSLGVRTEKWRNVAASASSVLQRTDVTD